ncbi:MAG TPA: LacI family DNA-binding transcriptional regulator [Candidatus Limnocylindria bacterium]|nr:LacI family DNA-binding transcriptional regulator [Candidatus Limnocylindria bacterium]
MARPRIDDVARRAGVSKTAVSFAFNQPEHLNAATRERILAAAAELGYRPSPIARRLARRRTDQIGLVVPQSTHDIFANPFLPELVRGIGDMCDAEGIAVVIVPPVGGSISRAVEAALVDGLILLGLVPDHPELGEVRRAGTPLVGLDTEGFVGHDVIGIDDVDATRRAAEHLHGLGHRDVAVVLIAEHPDSPIDERSGISARRLRGVRQGFGLNGEGGPSADGSTRLRVLSAPVSEEGGRAAFAAIAGDGDGEMPTAVMAMSDVTAIGLVGAALDAGLRLPDELSIVGFDDIPAASWTSPRLTTVHQPIREKGRRAAQQLIRAIRSGPEHQPVVELLPTRLVVRGSTAPPRGTTASNPAGGGGAATT